MRLLPGFDKVPRSVFLADSALRVGGAISILALGVSLLSRNKYVSFFASAGLATTTVRHAIIFTCIIPVHAAAQAVKSAALLGGWTGVFVRWSIAASFFVLTLVYRNSEKTRGEFGC